MIPMRDGTRLFTAVYAPRDASHGYPFLMTRTPYGVAPYGEGFYREKLGPAPVFQKEGFIFVYQDVRGRNKSEGRFVQLRPHQPDKRPLAGAEPATDESTDTYDTIEWLLKNIPNHNGKVGMWGISQPGFYVAAGMIDTHPALVAVAPQAPTADYYLGDDVYHNGAFMLAANFWFYSGFLPRPGGPELPRIRAPFQAGTPDGYEFFLGLGPLADVNQKYFKGASTFWQELVDHPTYDEFWRSRSLWRHMKNVRCAVLNVGGWYDAEDPQGPFRVYRAIEVANPGVSNRLVIGPWAHGIWEDTDGDSWGPISFGSKTSIHFQEQIQFPFFMEHLKGERADLAEATMFLTGRNEWRRLEAWPPKEAAPMTFYLGGNGSLGTEAPTEPRAYDEYVSDPTRPVPFINTIAWGADSGYILEDQRFAAHRTDVLVYRTEPLAKDLVMAGPIQVTLAASTSGTDSDFVVKVIDVYPGEYAKPKPGQQLSYDVARLGGYQQLVRGEPFRAKYRKGFETPVPMTPNQPATLRFDLPDIFHAFRKGHRIMVQVQSSWFPLVDRNPQKFMDIPKAKADDFQRATQRVHRSRRFPSSVTFLNWTP